MARKMMSGNGWSFEPAGGERNKDVVVSLPDDRQKARVALEKRARGKEVTVVSGFVLSEEDRAGLARKLRKACGAGGTDSAGTMEVQGDHRERVKTLLSARGWTV